MSFEIDNIYKDITTLKMIVVRIEKYLNKQISITDLIYGLRNLLNHLTVVNEQWKIDSLILWINLEAIYALALDEKTGIFNLNEVSILECLNDLKKMTKLKLDEFLKQEIESLSHHDPRIKQLADDLGNHWLMCPLCQESWENHLQHPMVRCPKCDQRLHNPQSKRILRWSAESDLLQPRRYEIKYFPALGYYLYVFENEVRIYDYFYDTWEAAIDYALKEFGVAKDLWKKDE